MSSLFLFLGYLNAKQSAAKIFQYLVSISTVFGVLNWINILVAYFGMLRAVKFQNKSRSEFPYTAPLQPYSAGFALFMTILIVSTNGNISKSL
jgi:yeast amino acid transporter